MNLNLLYRAFLFCYLFVKITEADIIARKHSASPLTEKDIAIHKLTLNYGKLHFEQSSYFQ